MSASPKSYTLWLKLRHGVWVDGMTWTDGHVWTGERAFKRAHNERRMWLGYGAYWKGHVKVLPKGRRP